MKLIKILLLSILYTINIQPYTGKTFFMPRPILQDIVLQKVSSHEFIKKFYDDKNNMNGFKILGTTFYKESTNSSDLASYFFPENKTELTVQGPDVPGTPDVSSTWLTITNKEEDLVRDFSSKIKIEPKQKSFGFNLQIFKNFNSKNKRVMISASFPFMQVETDLNFSEYDRSTTLEKLPQGLLNKTISANAEEYFDSRLLFYGKMKNGVQKLAGLADIKLSMDGLLKINNLVDINLYAFSIVPTGYHPKVEYLFEPIIGNGGHFSLGCGANLDCNIWKQKNKKLIISGGAEYQYLFEATNKRTFDLKNNGTFSRYLDVIQKEPFKKSITYLANVSTLDCKVTPRSTLNNFINLSYLYKNYNLKLGYNFWWRNSEKLKLKENLEQIYAITGMDIGDAGEIDLVGYFNKATIKSDAGKNPQDNFLALTNNDLDLSSGRIPSAFSNKFHASIGFDGNFADKKYWLNTGFSYEIKGKNSSLTNWNLFLQLSLSL